VTAVPGLVELVSGACGPGACLLDVGCHAGELLVDVRAVRPDLRLRGVDLDAAGVAAARAAGLDAQVGRADRLPDPDGSVDVLTLLDVLEHVPADRRAAVLDEARRVLVPGGLLVLQTPHAGTFQWLDPQNLRHRFPRLYRRVVRSGVRDAAYDGQEVVWHEHFTRAVIERLLGPGWSVESVAHPGRILLPLADLASWPFHRAGRTDARPARALRALAGWDARRDGGPRHGYEIRVLARAR